MHSANSAATARTPLVLVPGLMCDSAVWEPLFPVLAPVAEFQVVDHRSADSITTMARQALDDAPEVFALAGHSMGGRVALEMLRLAPQRVLRLALLDTGFRQRVPGPQGDAEARGRHALLALARTEGVRAMANQWVQGMVHPARLADAGLLEAIVAMFQRQSADTFAHQIHALLNRPDAAPVMAGVRVPTLVLCGREDSWAPVSQHEEIAALVPGWSTLRVVESCGHMSPMEQPQAVGHALLEWLQSGISEAALAPRAA